MERTRAGVKKHKVDKLALRIEPKTLERASVTPLRGRATVALCRLKHQIFLGHFHNRHINI